MNKTIWKFKIPLSIDYQKISMPQGAEFLYFGVQDALLCAWFLVIPDALMGERTFKIYGTGHEIPMREKYHGTVIDGPFVWHLHERLGE